MSDLYRARLTSLSDLKPFARVPPFILLILDSSIMFLTRGVHPQNPNLFISNLVLGTKGSPLDDSFHDSAYV